MTSAISYADALILFIDAEKSSNRKLLDGGVNNGHRTQDWLSFNESPFIAMANKVKQILCVINKMEGPSV